jgi:hypothetical protein
MESSAAPTAYDQQLVLAAVKLYPSLPSKSVDAFPAGWRKTVGGRFVYAVAKQLGWNNWGEVPADNRNQFRALFSLFVAGLLPDSPPPDVAAPVVAVRLLLPPPPSQEGEVPVSVTVSLLSSDVLQRAEFGDALQKWDIRLIAFAMQLTGPVKNRWLNYYASNAHMAAYLCGVKGLPFPSEKRAIKHAGDQFESEYLDSDFRSKYVAATFGVEYLSVVTSSLKELL